MTDVGYREAKAVELPEAKVAWDLRRYWATSQSVRLTLTERCMIDTVVGTVSQVAVTGAFAVVDGWQIPCVDVRGIGKPTRDDTERYGAVMRRLREEQAQHFRTEEAA